MKMRLHQSGHNCAALRVNFFGIIFRASLSGTGINNLAFLNEQHSTGNGFCAGAVDQGAIKYELVAGSQLHGRSMRATHGVSMRATADKSCLAESGRSV